MKIEKIRMLLSCHGWEDFPTHLTGDDAENLLNCWTTLWHPEIVRQAQTVPNWHRVDSPPDDCQGFLFVVPSIARDQMTTGFAQRVQDQGGLLIDSDSDRTDMTTMILDRVGVTSAISKDRIATFRALGFIYLQVQILTRQYRYSSSLDDAQFERLCVEAAIAALEPGNQFDTAIVRCFDLLSEERNRYFSNEIYLIDQTLVTKEVVSRVGKQTEWSIPSNLMMSGSLISSLKQEASWEAIKKRVDEKQFCFVGGEWNELQTQLLSLNSVASNLKRGAEEFSNSFGQVPSVFARQRFAALSAYPGVLDQLNFSGAVHTTLDDGRFPTDSSQLVNWSGFSNVALPALVEPPFDITLAESFLKLAGNISLAIDRSHIAVVSFVHWAGQSSTWYSDLMTAAKVCSTLGKFVTLDHLLEREQDLDTSQHWLGDNYQSPILKQAIIRGQSNSVSKWQDYWTSQARLKDCSALLAMAHLYSKTEAVESVEDEMTHLQVQIDESTDNDGIDTDLIEKVEVLHDQRSQVFVKALSDSQGDGGYLIINPQSNSRRQWFELDCPGVICDDENAIYCQESDGQRSECVVDVPAFGFVFLKKLTTKTDFKLKPMPLIDRSVIRNEYFQITTDQSTGGIRSMQVYNERGNWMSQQLAFRRSDQRRNRNSGTSAHYSIMKVDSTEINRQSLVRAELTSIGRLVQEENVVANFRQSISVTRGIRVFDINISLEPLVDVRADPWNEYVACRMAWSNEASRLFRSINDSRDEVTIGKIESPLYLEVDQGMHKLTVFPGGVPFHKRDGYRMLDSMLVVSGEERRDFKLSVGLDVKYPSQAAYNLLSPMVAHDVNDKVPSGHSAWLFHFSSRNVIPLKFKSGEGSTEILLKETEGRTSELRITCPRKPTSAWINNLAGDQLAKCEIDGDQIKLKMSSHTLQCLLISW